MRSFIYNFKTVVLTTCLFLTVWLIFAEFNFDSLMVGVFFIFFAVAMNQWLLSVYKEKVAVKSSIRLSMLPNFIFSLSNNQLSVVLIRLNVLFPLR